jgi:TusA-related sulfurtransferase
LAEASKPKKQLDCVGLYCLESLFQTREQIDSIDVVIYESEPLEIRGSDEVEKVLVHDLDEDEEYELFVDAIIILK